VQNGVQNGVQEIGRFRVQYSGKFRVQNSEKLLLIALLAA
jgi:hypothetical protein